MVASNRYDAIRNDLTYIPTDFFAFTICYILREIYVFNACLFENSVTWNKKTLEYILKNGENVKKIDIDGKERYFILRKEDNLLIVKETTATDEEIRKVFDGTSDKFILMLKI